MAHVVAKGRGTFEIRESQATTAGPRSRTLAGTNPEANANAEAAAAWIGATSQRRGEALVDLLLLVDSLPPKRVPDRRRFPRIESRPISE